MLGMRHVNGLCREVLGRLMGSSRGLVRGCEEAGVVVAQGVLLPHRSAELFCKRSVITETRGGGAVGQRLPCAQLASLHGAGPAPVAAVPATSVLSESRLPHT